jgi:EmrB/QacA subfamily drug resistance transporter
VNPEVEAGGTESGLAAVAPASTSGERWLLVATILGSSMAFIDGTVVNVALPVLQRELRATVADLQWIVVAYALFLAALTLVGGALGDRYGRRRIYALGIAIFAVASLACAVAPNVTWLIWARGAQGVGGALLVPGSLAIITAAIAEERRGRAIGTWSGFTTLTTALGPVLGGWLIDHASWRAAFLINAPLAAVVLVVLFWRVPESRDPEAPERLDWAGALLVTLGLGAISFGLIEYNNQSFGAGAMVAAVALGILLLAGFVLVEARGQAPMVRLELFRSRTFTGTNLLTLLLYGALGGALFFLSFNLIQVQGYSATEAGAALLPFIAIMFVLSRWSGGLVTRTGPKPPLVVGSLVVAAGFVLFARPGVGGSYWTTFFPAICLMGLGMALVVAPLTTTVMGSVPAHQAGVASGLNNSVARLAGLLAVALLGILALAVFSADLDRRLSTLDLPAEVGQAIEAQRTQLAAAEPPAGLPEPERAAIRQALDEAFVATFRAVMLSAAALGVGSAVVALVLVEGRKT